MNKFLPLALLGAFLLGTSACQQTVAPAPPAASAVTQEEAAKVLETATEVWASMDAARIKAVYAPDVAGFDFTGPLVIGRPAWDKVQDGFASFKIDKLVITAKTIQLLGPDAFMTSLVGQDISSTVPKNNAAFRCTDVFTRATGKWLVVNEHCSPGIKAG